MNPKHRIRRANRELKRKLSINQKIGFIRFKMNKGKGLRVF